MVQKHGDKLARLNLTQRFILASLVVFILGILVIGWWVNKQIADGVIHRTSATTALFVDSIIVSHLQELATSNNLSGENIQTLDQLLSNSPLGQQIVSIKVWDTDGVVQYSTDKASMGEAYPIENGLAKALNGEMSSEISDLQKAENVGEKSFGSSLIETYIPVRQSGTGEIIAVAEFYQKVDELERVILAAQVNSWMVVAGSMLVIFLALIGFVKNASNTIDRQNEKMSTQVMRLSELLEQNNKLHERVRLASASVTTLNERLLRRIGSELHDGPAQDLSLALMNLDTVIGQVEDCEGKDINGPSCNARLDSIQTTLQNALSELRAISSGLGLPELANLTISEVVMRVVRAHERKTGTKVALELGELPEQLPLPGKITVYRVIQEALNNAYRHAQGIGQCVNVYNKENHVIIEISDQGAGFDTQQGPAMENHLGIVGMRERVESLGGSFSIESGQKSGTRITARLNLITEGANYG